MNRKCWHPSLNTALLRMLEPAACVFSGIHFYFSWFMYSETQLVKWWHGCAHLLVLKLLQSHILVSPHCDLGRFSPPHLGYLLVGDQHAHNLWGGSGKPAKTQVSESMDSARTLPIFILSLGHKNHRGPGMRAGALNQVSPFQCALSPLRLA